MDQDASICNILKKKTCNLVFKKKGYEIDVFGVLIYLPKTIE